MVSAIAAARGRGVANAVDDEFRASRRNPNLDLARGGHLREDLSTALFFQEGRLESGLPDDPLYFVDTDAIKLGDLRLCHAIARQRADAPELRCGYRAGFAPDCPPPSCRFRLGRRFYLCRFHWRRRQDAEDTRLASRLRFGGRDGVFGRRCRVDRPGLRPRLKQVFRIFSRSVDLFAINVSVRRAIRSASVTPDDIVKI